MRSRKICFLFLVLLLMLTLFLTACTMGIPTIEISEDGYWIINGEKTDVYAKGEKGDTGAQGEKGDKGDDGVQGEKGDKGDKGDAAAVENPQGLAFYLKDDGTYAVEIGYAKYLSRIEIPATYNGNAVTEVGDFNSETLKEIVIPNSVTSIAKGAFRGCSSLKSMTIPFVGAAADDADNNHFGYIFGATSYNYNGNYVPSSLKTVVINGGESIGGYAFAGCSSLTFLTIPDSVTSVAANAFAGCTQLIEEKNGVSYVGSWVVGCDPTVTTVSLREGTRGIVNYAFRDCTLLTSVTLPDTVISIGNGAFSGCSALASINIPASVTSLNIGVFNGCPQLIEEENGVSYIDSWVFDCDPTVTTVSLREGTRAVGDNAFNDCDALQRVVIPATVTHIGYAAFAYCDALVEVIFADGGNDLLTIDGAAFYKCNALTAVTLPNRVRAVGVGAFQSCAALSTVVFTSGTNTTNIGERAFAYCGVLVRVEIPKSVIGIGPSAFSGSIFATIYTAHAQQPDTWDEEWNPLGLPVVWGYSN